MQTGERQSARMRVAYLKAMLAQDVGFFDTDASTGEIVSRISSDTVLVQDAISEKVRQRVLEICDSLVQVMRVLANSAFSQFAQFKL
jgi:ABC-type multidrug transport system fused ATPase/permease subunit